MSTVVRASSDHTPVIEIHRQSDTHALVGCPARKASERPMSHVSRQASVAIPALFDAIRTELGAIVIDKTELPEATHDGIYVEVTDEAWPASWVRENVDELKRIAHQNLALIAWAEANPPVDPKVQALATRLWGLKITPDAHELAKTLIDHGIDIKDPS